MKKKDFTVVRLKAMEFRRTTANFLVNPGSNINLIKLRALEPDFILGDNSIHMKGMTTKAGSDCPSPINFSTGFPTLVKS